MLRTEFTSLIAKSTSPGPLDMTFFPSCIDVMFLYLGFCITEMLLYFNTCINLAGSNYYYHMTRLSPRFQVAR